MTALAPAAAPKLESIAARAPRRRASPERIAAGLTIVALVAASVWALVDIDVSIAGIVDSWGNAERFFERVGTITFPEPAELVSLTALTLGLVLTGTLLAAVISVPVAYLAAGNTTPGPAWRAIGRFITVLTRAVPDIVLAMAFALMFTLGSLPGILAIGIHSVGMIAKLFADAIEQIDEGPRLAVRAAGGSKLQEFTSGILPQVLPSWIATVLHRFDINLRHSVVLGYVGVAGLGLEMSHAFKSLNYSLGIGIAIVMFVLCVVMEIVSSLIRRAMLGAQPTGRGLGDRFVRRVTSARPRTRSTVADASADAPAKVGAASPADLQAVLRRPWDGTRIRNVAWLWGAAAVIVAGVAVCDIHWADLVTVWAKVPAVAVQFWPPSFGSYDWATMSAALTETIAVALAATLLSFVFSLVIGSFAARNVAPNGGIRSGARLLLVGIRGVPEVILAILLIVITGLGSQAGMIALAFGGVGLLGKLIADSFEEVARGPERALVATGATRLQVYASATFPQGVPALIGHGFYLIDTNLRAATVLGIVGGGGIGYYLLNAGQGSNYDVVTSIVLMILVVQLVFEGLAVWMRRVFR
ncbi:phosphonate ABC transporter, permease protein PhnE [Agromyces sp. CFH 90414]|uniref:Phosphonate ABC transporter, permease protein PhnE n=1 Tax=Agromyces agglutinans TaxID=2662258 RepID=A0A6I2F7Y8_9MICO|nr:phosphonate ABC transporter, permease protein PhnE [Agromyces agglutinans]MRG58890.1 phosphonate ABC transporter, permease protein PhnE [Agromyces agglutinans]